MTSFFPTPSHLPETARAEIIEALTAALVDGIDLYTQAKTAHWNVKGPHFAATHGLFDELAGALAAANDELAERAVTLGGRAPGTARQVAAASRLADYPEATVRDLELVRHLAERVEGWLEGARRARGTADELGDEDTADLLTAPIRGLEKLGWMLRATLEG